MAYEGYLLKIGNYKFPLKYMGADKYKAYINMQDLNPWTDAKGFVHRNAVDLKAAKAEFETVANLTNVEFSGIMSNIYNNFTDAKKRECEVTFYIPEIDDYVTQTSYMADITPQIYYAGKNKITYDPIRFAFIGGVYRDE